MVYKPQKGLNMIRTAREMRNALRRNKFTGVILYQGPSAINGRPIVVVANRITVASTNAKTGDMVQTFIIPADVDPMSALRTGQDESVCGDCAHRPVNKGSCYVNVGRSVVSVFGALSRGRYARPGIDYDPAMIPDLFAGLAVRVGTYGDPFAAPFQIWRAATVKAAAVNGYSHQWRRPEAQAFRLLCMASVDNEAEALEARAMGWRTFRVRAKGSDKLAGEVICPASKEAGHKTSCAECRACGGLSAKARAPIVIEAHGATAKRFVGA